VCHLCVNVSCVEMAESRWASELSALQTSQRHKYRDCVMRCAGVSFVCKCAGVSCVEMAESRWASELSALQTSQRHKYRDCVMKLHEQSHLPSQNHDSNTASPAYRSV